MPKVKYPKIKVKLVGKDGNAYSILARVRNAMRDAGVTPIQRDKFLGEATAGDYDHLLATCMKWVVCS